MAFICKNCGAYVQEKDADLCDYLDGSYDWICPKCGAEHQYAPDGKGTIVTNWDKVAYKTQEDWIF